MILYGIFYFVKQLLALAAPWCYLLFLEQVITKGRTEMVLPIFGAYLGLYVLQTGAEVLLKRQYQKILRYPAADGQKEMLGFLLHQPFAVLSELSYEERKRLVWEDPKSAVEWKTGWLQLVLQSSVLEGNQSG